MATRLKTVEYAFATNTGSLAAATRYEFPAITLSLAETSSRVIKSVIVQVTGRQFNTTAVSLTSFMIGVKLGATPWDDATLTNTMDNTGDPANWIFTRDAATYFNDGYFTGGTQTCQVAVQFGAVAVNNIAVKLIITYQFDDSSATTRTKTVRIPIESGTTTLTNALAEIGANQIPALTSVIGPFLPEASVSIKDIFFEIYANENHVSGTVDDQLGVRLDAESEVLFGTLEQALDSSPFVHTIWKRDDMDPTVSHKFFARGTTTARFAYLYAILHVTYTYDHSSSTRILNSLECAMNCENGCMGGPAADAQTEDYFKFWIQEPGTITLAQSAIALSYSIGNFSNSNILMQIGGSAYRTYNANYVLNNVGAGYTICQRFDGYGAITTPGITLTRGENILTSGYYSVNNAQITMNPMGLNALAYINYYSNKHTLGADVHNHTVKQNIISGPLETVLVGRSFVPAWAPTIPDTNWFINGISLFVQYHHNGRPSDVLTIAAELLPGERQGDGWEDVLNWTQNSNNGELTSWEIHTQIKDKFKTYAGDPDTYQLSPLTMRRYKITTGSDGTNVNSGYYALINYITYHSITYTVSGTITGYTGNGSGITVNIHRVSDNKLLLSTTSAIGGTFSTTWYDSTQNVYAHALQDSTHKGRSQNAAAY